MLNNILSHEKNLKVRVTFALAFAFMAGLAMTAFSVNVNAATFAVTTTADTQDAAPGNGTCADAAGACSLRAAISEANALAGADTITIPAGTYTQTLAGANEDVNAGGDLDITSPITINGAAAATTIIQGNAAQNAGTERVFHVVGAGATAVTINAVTIENGKALDATDGGRGGGIKIDGQTINFTLTNSTVRNNNADTRGGGLSINKGNLTVTGCTFTGNQAGSAFGTGGAGGAILVDSQDNMAVAGQVATISNTVMNANKAESTVANTFGGAVIVRALNATVTITGCTVTNNISNATGAFSGFAGGLYNQQATMNVIDTVVSNNTTSSFHAGIRNLASTAAPATLNVTRSTISNNSSASATGNGGGITNILGGSFDAVVSIDHSTISGNTLSGTTSIGGGLVNNVGAFPGLALMAVTNSTVSGNSAADIGGIYSDGATATTIIDFSTIVNNTANNTTNPQGGGVFQDTTAGGATFLSNSVVADNVAGADVDVNELVSSLDYNHIENPNPAFVAAANDVLGTDPGMGPLTNNGGPTQTHAPGALVQNTIPNGTNGCGNPINDDQRGQPRPFPAGGACDKGSVEGPVGIMTPTFTNTATPSATATNTPMGPTNTNTATATVTNTATNTATATATATATNTPMGPTFTATQTPTRTNTSTPTNTPTMGPTNTNTSTATATATATPTSTMTPPPVQTFSNTTPVCTTLGSPGSPYPSTITVAGGPSQIGNMRVVFVNFWHDFPDNFDALLVGPNGAEYVVMGDAGGSISISQNTPVTLTFADFLATVLPNSGPLVTGTTEPTTWESPVANFPAPAPPGPYIEAGSVPLGPIGTTMRGAFGFSNANGVWSLYTRDDSGGFAPAAITGCLDGGWQLQFVPLTAAQSSISGRVTTASGHGIRNAKIVVTGNSLSAPIIATTGTMGWYSIEGLASGQTYVVTVNSKRYTFGVPSRVISLVDNIVDADFTADQSE